MFSAESRLQYPVVGDWAFVQYYNSNTLAIILDLLPRKTILRRKTAGKEVDYQISRSDLVSQKGLERKVPELRNRGIKCEIIAYSVKTGSGLPQIKQVLKSSITYYLLGSSGVGKITLLNHLIGRDAFKINLVREKDGKGRHTTARRQSVVLDQGAMLIDTLGMRELGNTDVKSGIEKSFSDIFKLSRNCRFKDCTHSHEIDCSVLRAAQSGDLNKAHYQNYLKLKRISEHYQMSYVEKRREDKKFGQFIESVMKQNKKK